MLHQGSLDGHPPRLGCALYEFPVTRVTPIRPSVGGVITLWTVIALLILTEA